MVLICVSRRGVDGGKGAAVTGVAEYTEEDDDADENSREGVEAEEEDDEAECDEHELRGTARSASNCPGIMSLPCVYVHGLVKNEKSYIKTLDMLCEAPNTAVITATASTDRSQKAHAVQDELLDLSTLLTTAAILLLPCVDSVRWFPHARACSWGMLL